MTSRPDLPFKYVGGDPSLDLVNTVDWTESGLQNDRLTNYDRMTQWAEGAGLLPGEDAHRLRQSSAGEQHGAQTAFDEARWLRWVLQRLFGSLAAGEPPGRFLDDFNDLLTLALRRLHVAPPHEPGAGPAEWAWRGAGEDLGSVLWPVVWSAAALLTSEDAGRIRVCAAPDCGWIYVDRSRNGLRRWCQMETCGTREKSRRRNERSRDAG